MVLKARHAQKFVQNIVKHTLYLKETIFSFDVVQWQCLRNIVCSSRYFVLHSELQITETAYFTANIYFHKNHDEISVL